MLRSSSDLQVQDLQKELSRIATNLGKPVREPVGRLAGNRLLTSPVQKAAAASEEEAGVTPVSPRTADISARLEAAAALPGATAASNGRACNPSGTSMDCDRWLLMGDRICIDKGVVGVRLC